MSGNPTQVEEPAHECFVHSKQGDSEVPVSVEIKEAFGAVNESAVKGKQAQWRRKSYVRKKLCRLQEKAEKTHCQSLGLDQPSTSQGNTKKDFVVSDFVQLMNDLKSMFRQEDKREKRIQLLTLAPHFWSRGKVTEFFGASERQVHEAIKIKEECGVLCMPKKEERSLFKRSREDFSD